MRTLVLRRGEDRRLRSGHLWVFSNEVDVKKSPLTDFTPGEPATVTDHAGHPLGSACVNPGSLICARIHTSAPDVPMDKAFFTKRIADALTLRTRLFDAPWYRAVYGEGDGIPGLVVDRFGDIITVQAGTAGLEAAKDDLRAALQELFQPKGILWDNDTASRGLEGLSRERSIEGEVPAEITVPENGCRYAAPLLEGQKTGWYYDQRPNRAEVAALARGADVLDAFCYAGGFGAAAGKAGAASVTFLDASETALSFARRNLTANAPACPCETIHGDAFEALQALRASGRKFDVVSIDPPAFIKRRKDMKDGIAAYRRLNHIAAGLVKENGYLVTSSCSQHFSLDDLRTAAALAAKKNGFLPRLIYMGFQGPDHPVHAAMPETAYLKCLVLQLCQLAV